MINNRQNGRRRGRGGQPQRGGQPGMVDRGNRIDNRARGNANQLHEKYKTLARDAQMQGDRVTTEYYLQFADHYFRVLMESRARFEEQRRPRDDEYERGGYEPQGRDDYGDDDGDGFEADGGEGERAQAREERPREQRYANGNGFGQGSGEERGERGPRRPRFQPREAEPDGRAERIEFDRLPPAFATASEGPAETELPHADEGEAKPRRRGRPRRNPDGAPAEV